jgi:hypothetical protein
MLDLLLPLEESHSGGFIAEYIAILTDPAHMAVEFTFMTVVDGLLLGLLWPFVRRFIDAKMRKQHEEFDREHGIQHHGDHVHIDPKVLHVHDDAHDAID